MNPDQDYEFLIKLLIIGDSTVGKTNFVSKFIESKFNENYFASTGIDLKNTSIKIDGYKTLSEGQDVTYQLIKTDKGLQATNVIPVNQSELVAAF
jgi:GTPase SAR1 family protein